MGKMFLKKKLSLYKNKNWTSAATSLAYWKKLNSVELYHLQLLHWLNGKIKVPRSCRGLL